jgi:translin
MPPWSARAPSSATAPTPSAPCIVTSARWRLSTSPRPAKSPPPSAGYTQDALKEFAEANIVYALVGDEPLPEPEAIGVEYAAYLNGLGEAAGELRRRCLDIIRHAHSDEAERLLAAMDDIYSLLVTVDYPDAITGGLRRTTDMVRGVTERTRGDITTSLRQYQLQEALRRFSGPDAP